MLPACPPRSRSTPKPAFAWQLAAAPQRRAGPHPAPLSSGVYCVVAFCPSLTGNTTSHTSHTSLKNPQNPHPVCCGIACFEPRFASWREISQHTPSGGHLPMFAHTRRRFKSSVLRYLDFRPGLRPDLRDIAAQYSTDLIKGAEHRRVRDIHPLSSGASHVPVLPPAPRTPRPLEHQEHQGPWGPPCVLRYWGFRAPFQPIFLENAAHNTAEYGMSRPAGRRRRRQAANHTPRLCVLRYLDFRPGLRPDLRDIAAQYSTDQPNQPPPPPPTLQKCSAQRANAKHLSSVLRFLRFSGHHKPQQPDIAAHTASGRGEVAQVRRGA